VNLRQELPPLASTVVANLTAPLLAEVAARLPAPPGRLVCSGALVAEGDGVSGAFMDAGLRETARRVDGDWLAISFAP
jgi:hypothetical protein